MPLIKSGSKSAVSENIREMMHAGHPHDQSVAAALSTARKYGHASGGKVHKVMHEFKHHELHSGSKKGPLVKGRSQAIAIALSEARKAGKRKADGGSADDQNHSATFKERFPAAAWTALGVKDRGPNIDSAFSNVNDEYPLGNALRKKVQGKAFGGPNMESMVLRGSSYGLRREGMINSSIPGRTDKLPMRVRTGSYVLPADIPSALGQGNSMAGGEILKKMFSSGPYGLPTMRGAGRPNVPRLGMRPVSPKIPKGPFADGGSVDEKTRAAGRAELQQKMGGDTPWYKERYKPGTTEAIETHQGLRAMGIDEAVRRDIPTRIPGVNLSDTHGYAHGGETEDDDSHVPIVAAGGEFILHPDVVRDIGHGNIKAGHDVLDKFVLQVRKHNIKTLSKLPGPKK